MQNLSGENEFHLHENTNHFHFYCFALSLALKQRLGNSEVVAYSKLCPLFNSLLFEQKDQLQSSRGVLTGLGLDV